MEQNSSISEHDELLTFKANPSTELGTEIGVTLIPVIAGMLFHYFFLRGKLHEKTPFLLSLAIGAGCGALYFGIALFKLKTRGSKALVIKGNEVIVEDRKTKETFLISDVIKAKLANKYALQWEFDVRYRTEPLVLPMKPFLPEEQKAIQEALVKRMSCEKQLTLEKWEPLN